MNEGEKRERKRKRDGDRKQGCKSDCGVTWHFESVLVDGKRRPVQSTLRASLQIAVSASATGGPVYSKDSGVAESCLRREYFLDIPKVLRVYIMKYRYIVL
jgi:hypothetical protein